MLPDRSQQELAAMRRLSASADFAVFMGWLGRALEANRSGLVACEDATRLRWLQGQAQALQDVVLAVESTRQVMERMGC